MLIWSLILKPASMRSTRGTQVRHGVGGSSVGARSSQTRMRPPTAPSGSRDAHPGCADYPSLAEYERAKSRYAAGTPIAPGQVELGDVE